ncbi:hypothetical protein ACVWXN_006923 [Bradyrhizobium sp. i1.4.4]
MNMSYALLLDGPLDTSALAEAFQDLLHEYPILKTRLVPGATSKDAAGHTKRAAGLSTGQFDVSNDRWTGIRSLAAREAIEQFDLTHHGPMRARLVGLESDLSILLVTFHHVAADAWALSLYARFLSERYRLQVSGSSLPNDNSARDQLLMRPVSRPTAPDAALQDRRGTGHRFTIATSFSWDGQLRLRLSQARSTLFSALVASVAASIARRGEMRAVSIGYLAANRATSATMRQGGAFYGFRLINIDVDPGRTAGDFVASVTERLSEDYDRALAPPLDLGIMDVSGINAFVTIDSFPLSEISFEDVEIFPLCFSLPPGSPLHGGPVSTLHCGRLSVCLRTGELGETLNIFTEPGMASLGEVVARDVCGFLATLVEAPASPVADAHGVNAKPRPLSWSDRHGIPITHDLPVEILSPPIPFG